MLFIRTICNKTQHVNFQGNPISQAADYETTLKLQLNDEK